MSVPYISVLSSSRAYACVITASGRSFKNVRWNLEALRAFQEDRVGDRARSTGWALKDVAHQGRAHYRAAYTSELYADFDRTTRSNLQTEVSLQLQSCQLITAVSCIFSAPLSLGMPVSPSHHIRASKSLIELDKHRFLSVRQARNFSQFAEWW